jgi:hypothetical protein
MEVEMGEMEIILNGGNIRAERQGAKGKYEKPGKNIITLPAEAAVKKEEERCFIKRLTR